MNELVRSLPVAFALATSRHSSCNGREWLHPSLGFCVVKEKGPKKSFNWTRQTQELLKSSLRDTVRDNCCHLTHVRLKNKSLKIKSLLFAWVCSLIYWHETHMRLHQTQNQYQISSYSLSAVGGHLLFFIHSFWA